MASKSGSKAKRTVKAMDEALVETYLAQLEAALGDDPAFMALVERMKADKLLKTAELAAIATRFMSPTPTSTSKVQSFEKIVRRHKALYTLGLKAGAMRGRSAA